MKCIYKAMSWLFNALDLVEVDAQEEQNCSVGRCDRPQQQKKMTSYSNEERERNVRKVAQLEVDGPRTQLKVQCK